MLPSFRHKVNPTFSIKLGKAGNYIAVNVELEVKRIVSFNLIHLSADVVFKLASSGAQYETVAYLLQESMHIRLDLLWNHDSLERCAVIDKQLPPNDRLGQTDVSLSDNSKQGIHLDEQHGWKTFCHACGDDEEASTGSSVLSIGYQQQCGLSPQ